MSVTHSVHELLTESAYVKSVRHNPNILHHHQVCNKEMFNAHCIHVYDLPAYKISHAQLQSFISYCLQIKY